MGLDFEYMDGQTPLDEDDKDGLLISAVATRGELDEYEQKNIEQAVQWIMGRSFKPELVFSEKFVRDVHKRMYGDVWSWAGSFRTTNKNIGMDKLQIPTDLRSLLDDAQYWLENNIYGPDEVAIRFKHRMVSIHCFPNGNGRHSRMMADIIIEKIYKRPLFTWGASDLSGERDIRAKYLEAVKSADQGNYSLLLSFARS